MGMLEGPTITMLDGARAGRRSLSWTLDPQHLSSRSRDPEKHGEVLVLTLEVFWDIEL